MQNLVLIALSFIAVFVAPSLPVSAQSSNPVYRVVNVDRNDVLNVRAFGDPTAPIVGALAPDARNISVIEMRSGWWSIRTDTVRGWVASRFLERDFGPVVQKASIFDGFAYQYNNESSRTVGGLNHCHKMCEDSPNCRAYTFFKSRNLCRLMTRSDAALERNPDAVSSLVRPESNDQIAGLHPQHAAPAPETKVAPLQPTVSSQRSKRAALIIANSDYRYVPLLKNPVNDARALATALRSTGFQSVTVKTDLTREQMIAALREFATLADQSDWATVYYAGHGIEFGGVNYLVPVDAQLRFDRDIALETVELDKVISAIDSARALRLVVLDACRENPFLNRMRRSGTARSIGRGLAPVEPVAGTMIVYAAKAGEIAFDGDDANSPFAAALLKRMQTPKLEIRRLFDLVRDDVMAATRNRQQPFSYGSLPGSQDFYLVAQ